MMSDLIGLLLAISQVLTPLGVLFGIWVSWDNKRRLKDVHDSTNGLAQRNEQIARQLGKAEGKAEEQASPTPTPPPK